MEPITIRRHDVDNCVYIFRMFINSSNKTVLSGGMYMYANTIRRADEIVLQTDKELIVYSGFSDYEFLYNHVHIYYIFSQRKMTKTYWSRLILPLHALKSF